VANHRKECGKEGSWEDEEVGEKRKSGRRMVKLEVQNKMRIWVRR
jgi:hypothetical protein